MTHATRVLARTAAVAILVCQAVAANASIQYEIEAEISDFTAVPQIHGRLRGRITNTSARSLSTITLALFPNRFASEASDAGVVDDVTRPFIYPHERFVPGGIEVDGISITSAAGDSLLDRVHEVEPPDIPAGCLVALELARPLAPGAVVTVNATFTTTIPERFGAFGVFRNTLTALGGWHPYLVALGDDGSWLVDRYPPLASFDVQLRAAAGTELLLNGHHHRAADGPLHLTIEQARYLSLVVAPRFERTERSAGARRVVIYQRPERYAFRLGWGPGPRTVLVDTIAELAAELAPAGPAPDPLVVVTLPLRYHLTRPADGMVAISDRAFHVNSVLRPFHRAKVAAAIGYELARPAVTARETVDDYHWVAEGLGYSAGQRDRERHSPQARDVQGWIRLFNIFAIVDRFEHEPKIPFVSTFFPRTREDDPLRGHVLTFNRRMPPGGAVFEKLRAAIGDDDYYRLVVAYAYRPGRFRAQVDDVAGGDLQWFFESWIGPYPSLNYAVESTHLNERRGEQYHHQATVQRLSSRPVREAVDVAFEPSWRPGAPPPQISVWNAAGERAEIEATTPHPVHRVDVDPGRRLIEDTRIDNAAPWPLQIVLDSANVTVTSTQFGLAALGVMRRRYDYRKDVALLGFFNERGAGANIGARYHWGPQIDATGYRHNLFGYYTQVALDGDFKDDTRPDRRTDGNIGGFGLRYDYTNVLNPDDPTKERALRLFADWYDDALGGDFSFVNWGAVATATQPIGSPLNIAALQIVNGFTDPVAGSRVPNQGLYSLGGTRSIRGIGVEDELGKNLFVVRAELRRTVYPEVDFNLADVLTLRRGQVRLFVDAGQVDDQRSTLYRPSHFAVGVGIGLAACYDFLGFYPAVAFIEVAGRVDQFHGVDNGPQILLGTRQSF